MSTTWTVPHREAAGSITWHAFTVAKVLEMTAELYYRICVMGKSYIPISEENIAAMQEFVAHSYGQPK